MNDPVYDVLLALHILAGLVGFGALGVTGAYGAAVRRTPDPVASASFQRYFRSGTNWASRSLFVVPLLGGALLGVGHGADAGQPYPWIGLGLWVLATGLASAIVWPAERRLQLIFESHLARDGEERAAVEVRGAAVRLGAQIEQACILTTLCYVAAFVVMVVQPG